MRKKNFGKVLAVLMAASLAVSSLSAVVSAREASVDLDKVVIKTVDGKVVTDKETGKVVFASGYTGAYFKGYDDNTVRPEAYITRAELAQLMYTLAADPTKTTYGISSVSHNPSAVYSDVGGNVWYGPAVSYVTAKNIFKGFEGKFRPDDQLTRAEFVTVMNRFGDIKRGEISDYTDITGHWAYGEIVSATLNKLVEGKGNKMFDPDGYIKRCEVAKVLDIYLNRGYKVKNVYYADVVKLIDAQIFGRDEDKDEGITAVEAFFPNLKNLKDLGNRDAWYFYWMADATNPYVLPVPSPMPAEPTATPIARILTHEVNSAYEGNNLYWGVNNDYEYVMTTDISKNCGLAPVSVHVEQGANLVNVQIRDGFSKDERTYGDPIGDKTVNDVYVGQDDLDSHIRITPIYPAKVGDKVIIKIGVPGYQRTLTLVVKDNAPAPTATPTPSPTPKAIFDHFVVNPTDYTDPVFDGDTWYDFDVTVVTNPSGPNTNVGLGKIKVDFDVLNDCDVMIDGVNVEPGDYATYANDNDLTVKVSVRPSRTGTVEVKVGFDNGTYAPIRLTDVKNAD